MRRERAPGTATARPPEQSTGLDTLAGARYSTTEDLVGRVRPYLAGRVGREERAPVSRPPHPGLDTLAGARYSTTEMPRRPTAIGSAAEDHRGAVAEETLVGGDADPRTVDLAARRPGRAAARSPRRPGRAPGRGRPRRSRPDPPDGLTGSRPPIVVSPARSSASASPRLHSCEVLDPVQLERGGQVVDLGQVDVGRVDAGLLVRRRTDRLLEGQLARGHRARRIRGQEWHVDDGLGEGRA